MDEHASMTRRRLLRQGGLLAGTGALAAAGIGKAAPTASAGVEATNFDVWVNAGGPGYADIFKLGAERYTKKTGGYANVQLISTLDYGTKLKTAVAGGAPPDIAQIGTGALIADLIAANALVPLDSAIKTGFPKFFPNLLADLSFNGKLYAIPVDANSLHVAYNKNLFKKYHLQPPTTINEFIQIKKVLGQNGIQCMGAPLPAFAGSDLFFQYVAYVDQTNNAIHLADKGKLSWTDKRFVEALGYVQQYAKNELANGPSWTNPTYDLWTDFLAQRLGMVYPIGNFATEYVNGVTKGKFEWGVFPLPAPRAGTPLRSTGGAAVSFSLFAGAKNPAAALDYIRLLCDRTGKVELVAKQFIPSSSAPPYGGKFPPIYKYWLKYQKTVGTRFLLNAKVSQALLNGTVELYTKGRTPLEVAQSMAAAAKS